MNFPMIEAYAKHYVSVLRTDSPIVSKSHLVRIEYRKSLTDEEYEEFNKVVDALLTPAGGNYVLRDKHEGK